MLTLKPQDIAILLKVASTKGGWTIAGLAGEAHISASETHAALLRCGQARLFSATSRKINVENFQEFLFHGLSYVFIATRGEVTRGMPTSIAAPPLVGQYFDEPELPPVWPHPLGLKRGYALEPLYRRAPEAATANREFYELLALTDALREGAPRVRKVAIDELTIRLTAYERYRNE